MCIQPSALHGAVISVSALYADHTQACPLLSLHNFMKLAYLLSVWQAVSCAVHSAEKLEAAVGGEQAALGTPDLLMHPPAGSTAFFWCLPQQAM